MSYDFDEMKPEITEKFVVSNKLKLRTQDEIKDLLKDGDVLADDHLGFKQEVLLEAMTFQTVKDLEWLRDDLTDEELIENEKEFTGYTSALECTKEFISYLYFAFDKADNERGLSASRSVQKLSMWLWLLGKDKLSKYVDSDSNYHSYGKPILAKIADEFNLPMPDCISSHLES